MRDGGIVLVSTSITAPCNPSGKKKARLYITNLDGKGLGKAGPYFDREAFTCRAQLPVTVSWLEISGFQTCFVHRDASRHKLGMVFVV